MGGAARFLFPRPIMTKIYDFLYPIYRPDHKLNTLLKILFQTCLVISSPVQTDVKGIMKGFADGVIGNDEKLSSSKNPARFKSALKQLILFETTLAKINTPLMTDKAKAIMYPLEPHTPL